MAQLDIKITTKYDQAQQGFKNVSESVKTYRKELIEAQNSGAGLDKAIENYEAALNKAIQQQDYMKDGMVALKAQSKLLKNEIFELNSAFNSDYTKKLQAALQDINDEMSALPASTKKAAGSMAEFEKSSGNAATKLLSVAKNILKFQLLMGPITGAIRGFKNTLSDSIKVAAEAEQVFNKLSTVFAGLEENAKSAASAISQQLGVATSTAASALSTVGDLLQAQGMGTSQSLTTASSWVSQFQDIIAFKDINMSLEEFAQTFMSGAAGNLRNFRQFGSIVKESAVNARLAAQGLDKLTGSELELAKMTARATIALEQQENAMGATEREWESALSVNRRLSEAWKEYKENLGETINRTLKPMKSWLTDVLDYANDVTRALKEIDGGEFTVKVIQESSEELYKRIRSVVSQLVPEQKRENLTVGQGVSTLGLSTIAPVSKSNVSYVASGANQYSANQIKSVLLSLGITADQYKEAVMGSIYEVDDATLREADRLANAYRDLQEVVTEAKNAILSSAEGFDTFTESLANLAHVSVRSTNLASIGEGINEYNYEDIMESFGQTASNQVSTVLKAVMRQFRSFGTDTFTSDFDKVFGTGNQADAYTAWMKEIEDLYTILYNREQKFGDVGQAVLDDVIDEWGRVNRLLQEYNDGLKEAADREAALKTAQNVADDYRTQLNNYGKSSFDITYNSLLSKSSNALSGEEANLYADAARDFKTVIAKELIDSFSGMAYAAQMATMKMTDEEKALYDLEQQYKEAAKSTALTAEDQKKLTDNYNDQRAALIRLQEAQKGYNDFMERLAQRNATLADYQTGGTYDYVTQLANLGKSSAQITREGMIAARDAAGQGGDAELWLAIQKQIDAFDELQKATVQTTEATKTYSQQIAEALFGQYSNTGFAKGISGSIANSTGGRIIQAGIEGAAAGGPWGAILGILMQILSETESFQEILGMVEPIVDMFDQLIAPLVPAIQVITDLLNSTIFTLLRPLFPVIKEISKSIVIIGAVVQTIHAILDNVLIAIHNVIEWIKHPISGGDQQSFHEITDIWKDIGATLKEIDDLTFSMDKKMDKDADIAAIRELYQRGIINEKQYAEAARVTKGAFLDTTVATNPSYVGSDRPTSISISYGNITLNINGDDPVALRRELDRYFDEQGILRNTALGA